VSLRLLYTIFLQLMNLLLLLGRSSRHARGMSTGKRADLRTGFDYSAGLDLLPPCSRAAVMNYRGPAGRDRL
jgi:hypothetical protein